MEQSLPIEDQLSKKKDQLSYTEKPNAPIQKHVMIWTSVSDTQ
jgi:hypothetical protein